MSLTVSSGSSVVTQVRMFLEANSALELVRLQLQNNLKLGGQCSYTDFSQAKNGKWYCWFLIDVERLDSNLFKKGK